MKHKKRYSNFTFKISEKIGSGCFGDVYAGKCLQTGEEVAIKKEYVGVHSPQLFSEMKIVRILNNSVGFPSFFGYWPDDGFNALAETLLGKNLIQLFRSCNHKFSLKTIFMLAEQMISRLEFLHSKDIIHRDIKPENFLIGRDKNQNVIYLADFGLSKFYRDSISHIHIPYREGRPLVGTARYVSINIHNGIEPSRRDDLESLAYLLIYFAKGRLPWQGFNSNDKIAKRRYIYEKKQSISVDSLCEGLPPEFAIFLESTRKLNFEETPCYTNYKALFRSALVKMSESYDYKFCWLSPNSDPIAESRTIKNNYQISLQKSSQSQFINSSSTHLHCLMAENHYWTHNRIFHRSMDRFYFNHITSNLSAKTNNTISSKLPNAAQIYNNTSNSNNAHNNNNINPIDYGNKNTTEIRKSSSAFDSNSLFLFDNNKDSIINDSRKNTTNFINNSSRDNSIISNDYSNINNNEIKTDNDTLNTSNNNNNTFIRKSSSTCNNNNVLFITDNNSSKSNSNFNSNFNVSSSSNNNFSLNNNAKFSNNNVFDTNPVNYNNISQINDKNKNTINSNNFSTIKNNNTNTYNNNKENTFISKSCSDFNSGNIFFIIDDNSNKNSINPSNNVNMSSSSNSNFSMNNSVTNAFSNCNADENNLYNKSQNIFSIRKSNSDFSDLNGIQIYNNCNNFDSISYMNTNTNIKSDSSNKLINSTNQSFNNINNSSSNNNSDEIDIVSSKTHKVNMNESLFSRYNNRFNSSAVIRKRAPALVKPVLAQNNNADICNSTSINITEEPNQQQKISAIQHNHQIQNQQHEVHTQRHHIHQSQSHQIQSQLQLQQKQQQESQQQDPQQQNEKSGKARSSQSHHSHHHHHSGANDCLQQFELLHVKKQHPLTKWSPNVVLLSKHLV